MDFEQREAQRKEIELYYAGDAELYFRSKAEREKRERLDAEKAEIAERIEAERVKAEKLARIRAEETFKAQAREKFLSINSFATEKDFAEIYPKLRRQHLIDSMNPTPEVTPEWFGEEFR